MHANARLALHHAWRSRLFGESNPSAQHKEQPHQGELNKSKHCEKLIPPQRCDLLDFRW